MSIKQIIFIVLLFTTSSVNARTVITFWHAMGDPKDKVLNSLIKEFEKNNPDIKINAEFVGNYDVLLQKLLASLVAKRPPDISQVYENWTTRFKKAGCLVPIGEFIKTDPGFKKELEDFYPVFIRNNSYNNEIWTFPFNKSIYVLYYNSSIFKKEGIRVPGNMNEFLEMCRKLKKEDSKGKIKRYGFGFRLNVDIFSIIFYLNGGNFFNEDETKAIFNNKIGEDSLKFIVDLVKTYRVAYYTKDYLDNDFASERFTMFFATSPHYAYLKNLVPFPIGVAALPEGKVKTAPIAGTNLAIFKSSTIERQQACWKFIKWLAEPAQVAKWSIGTSYLPVRKKALKENSMRRHLTENKTELIGINELEYAVSDPRVKVWNEARIFISEAVEKAILGKLTPKEALDEAADKINILLYPDK